MKTNEIVRALRKNKMLSTVIPLWAHATIPYPFIRNGLKCLGFYFYQLKNVDGKHQIVAPIFQVVVTYPEAKIVSISTSPCFLSSGMKPNAGLGFYPGAGLKDKTLQDSNAAYEAYYATCDNFLLAGEKDAWLRNLEIVKEEGMEPYYSLFVADANSAPPARGSADEKTPVRTSRHVRNSVKFSPEVLRTIRKVKNFLSDRAFARQLKEFTRISQDFSREDYRVAVIGEFSRGKSTFLNGLIGRELLPTGNLPTTAVITQIRKGRPERMSFIGKDRSVSQDELTTENLEKYLADDASCDPEGVLDLHVDLPWLSSDNVVFYDTPGTGDLVGKRASIVLNAINACDFTIMAISARAACSMTEMQFLRDNVVLKKIPQIAIVVTKLDTIPEGERGKVVTFIRQKVSAIAPTAKFFLMAGMAGVDCSMFDAVGVDQVRENIVSAFASDKDVVVARERQFIQRISILLDEAEKEIGVVSAAESMSEQEQKETIRKLESAKTDIDIVRQDLSTECIAAKIEAQKQVSSLIDEEEKGLKKEVAVSIQHTGDIRKWLDVDYSHIAEKAFKATSRNLEARMNKRIANDKSVFAAVVSKRLSVRNLNISLPSFDTHPSDFDVNTDVRDLDKYRTGAKVATIGAMVLLAGLGPAVMIASGVGGILTDRFIKDSIEKQRADVLDDISAKIQSVFSELKDRAVDYLEECYGKLAKALEDETRYAVDNAIAKIRAAEVRADNTSMARSAALKEHLGEVRASLNQDR